MNNENRSALSIVADGQKKQTESERPNSEDIYEAAKKERNYIEHHEQKITCNFDFNEATRELIVRDECNVEMGRIDITDMFNDYMDTKEAETQELIHEKFLELVHAHPDCDAIRNYSADDSVHFAEIHTTQGDSIIILANEEELKNLVSFAELMNPVLGNLSLQLLRDVDKIQYIYPSRCKNGCYQEPFIGGWSKPYFHEFIAWDKFGTIGLDEIELLDGLIEEIENGTKLPLYRGIYSYQSFLTSFREEIVYMEHIIENMTFWDKKYAGQSYKIMKRYIKSYTNAFCRNPLLDNE